MILLLLSIIAISFSFLLLAQQASISIWLISYAAFSLFLMAVQPLGWITKFLLLCIFLILCAANIKPLRRIVSGFILKSVRGALPKISTTERDALEAGTVSFEGALFSGKPDFQALLDIPVVKLTAEEQAFLDGPVNELCRMIDDWEITHELTDLPESMWQFIKKHRFFGMIIPKQYGGLAFSATAQTLILSRLYGRSVSVATTISVPNSLGPAELLLKYGTEAQKNYYLPRLAEGIDIPCFALTGPDAGSDAASIPDKGIICKKLVDGQEITGILLNWNKRYITLCPIATLLGLAFHLYDPDNLLQQGQDLGICCALLPAHLPGITTGSRHFPLNTAFLNGPTQGKEVFVLLDDLIGGPAMIGKGWRMLMECLSAGRAISLPSSANGGVQFLAMVTGAYARIREQFNQPIALFEGIEEPLARIAGNAYLIQAALKMTASVIDQGAKPAIAGAILKYHTTERGRQMTLDAMDIHGGKGICLGPKNYLGRGYQNAPIAITVEGANILTRSLIIFGQGLIRCHPYIYPEMESARANDIVAFDELFWGHSAFVLSNMVRSFIFGWTRGLGVKTPPSKVKAYYQTITCYAAHLSFMADFSMLILGGRLKRKETLSARLGDLLSQLYLASAVLKHFYHEGEREEDLPFVHWVCQQLFWEADQAMRSFINNFPGAIHRFLLRMIVNPFNRHRTLPSDALKQQLALLLTTPNESRARLIANVFQEAHKNCPAGELEQAFHKIYALEPLEKKLKKMMKQGLLLGSTRCERIQHALINQLITSEEAQLLEEGEKLRQSIIAVDHFKHEALARAVMNVHASAAAYEHNIS